MPLMGCARVRVLFLLHFLGKDSNNYPISIPRPQLILQQNLILAHMYSISSEKGTNLLANDDSMVKCHLFHHSISLYRPLAPLLQFC